MTNYKLTRSTRKNKKFMLITPEGEVIHFGDSRYDDYTTHRDPGRKDSYIKRHRNEADLWKHSITNLKSPAYLSRWLLWENTYLSNAVKNIEDILDIKIDMQPSS